MISGLIGKKVGMTQILQEDGTMVPVTVIQAGPCVVMQKKTVAKDGYESVQLGFVEFIKPKRVTRGMAGHFKKAGAAPVRMLREIRVEGEDSPKTGDKVLCDIFTAKERVHVIGTSKGRGFGGLIKRHHFRGGRASHGSMFHRAAGSIGASAFPSRVIKGIAWPATWATTALRFGTFASNAWMGKQPSICASSAGPAGGYIVPKTGQ
jgi:large subunit ribosomal protein L3